MRIICLHFQGLFLEEDIELYRQIPFFDGEKEEGSYKSNKHIYYKHIMSPLALYRGKAERWSRELISMQALQLSSTVAFYDRTTDLYWLEKNRGTGELGWVSSANFKELVVRTFEPLSCDVWNGYPEQQEGNK